MLITSRNNPIVKKILSLQEKKYRMQYGEYLIEGEKMVREAFACRSDLRMLILSESMLSRGIFSSDEKTTILSDDLFSKISTEKSPQGVMAVLGIPSQDPLPPTKSCLLLDSVRDPGNLGTIIRTANAAGYEEIYLLDCTDPFSPKAVRSSMSGIFHVRLMTVTQENVFSVLSSFPLITADLDGENIFTFLPPERFCLVIGNEGHGISSEVREQSAYTITIPMRGTQESLNAGVSAGIAMYLLKREGFQN